MAEPQVEQNGIVWHREVDRKTQKVVFKRLRRIYTDTVSEDGSIPDIDAFTGVVRDAAKHPANEAVDGFDMRPWTERPDA